MNAPHPKPAFAWWKTIRFVLLICLSIVATAFGALLLLIFAGTLPFQFIYLLFLGWSKYLSWATPQMTFNREIALESAITLFLAIFGLHRILRRWAAHSSRETRPWQWRWTLVITAMVLMLCATSIAAVGMAHQIAWLCREPQIVEMHGVGRQTRALSNLKQVATAIRLYSVDHGGSFPATLDELAPDYLPDKELLFAAGSDGEPPEQVIYFPGFYETDNPHNIILASPRPFESPRGRHRVVIYLDTSGVIMRETEFKQALQQQRLPRLFDRNMLWKPFLIAAR